MTTQDAQAATLAGIARQVCAKTEIERLLRSVDAPFSGTWEDVVKKRIPDAVKAGRLTIAKLSSLVREAEEHGRQHVFLYLAAKGDMPTLLEEQRINKLAAESGFGGAVDSHILVDTPPHPTISEIRLERTPNAQIKALIVKQVRTREHRHSPKENRLQGRLRIEWVLDRVRAVNVVKLHADGLVEVRIFSHAMTGGRKGYQEEVDEFLKAIDLLIPKTKLSRLLLVKAKNTLLRNRKDLKGSIRWAGSRLRTDKGSAITFAASSDETDLLEDSTSERGLAALLQRENDVDCDETGVLIHVGEDEDHEPIWVKVALRGEDNEFTVPGQCSMAEYNYVLRALREHNA